MSNYDLWKYCTPDDVNEAILQFHFLDGAKIKRENNLKCLYAVSNHVEDHYRETYIPKRHGGRRKLLVPDYLLHTIQTNILKQILSKRTVSPYAKAYYPGAKIIENASPHVGAVKILKLDIKDFFENITYLMVYQQAFPAEYFPPAIRTMLTKLCCYKDYLPQGAVTSPMISNLVMKPFDEYMGKWCEERGLHYTRYCDDLTFSGEFDEKEVQNKVRSFLQVMGFELNLKKTKVLKRHHRQSVTGIVVNEKPQVSREYRRKLRREVYYCEKYGVREHLERTNQSEYLEKGEIRYLQHLIGKVNYILQVNPDDVHFQEILVRLKNIKTIIERQENKI